MTQNTMWLVLFWTVKPNTMCTIFTVTYIKLQHLISTNILKKALLNLSSSTWILCSSNCSSVSNKAKLNYDITVQYTRKPNSWKFAGRTTLYYEFSMNNKLGWRKTTRIQFLWLVDIDKNTWYICKIMMHIGICCSHFWRLGEYVRCEFVGCTHTTLNLHGSSAFIKFSDTSNCK